MARRSHARARECSRTRTKEASKETCTQHQQNSTRQKRQIMLQVKTVFPRPHDPSLPGPHKVYRNKKEKDRLADRSVLDSQRSGKLLV
jgi:hypothetical protein